MPRYVILEHDHPFLHWDLMLEEPASLRTWRLHSPPAAGPELRATRLPNHRLHYLDYEGPVSGNRGTVRQWDGGHFDWVTDACDGVEVLLLGTRWRGRLRLSRLTDDQWSGRWIPG